MNGIVTATATTFTWFGVNGTTPNIFSLSLGTGSFVAADGTDAIENLNNTTEPVDVVFPPQDFINFTMAPTLPSLDINFIPLGNGGSADCSLPASGTTPPQTCTPPIPGGSPVTFTNNNVNGAVTGSAATWTFSGVTSDGLSDWNAVFTTQFVGQSFQQVLTGLSGPGGSITASYSANVTVSAIPEPATMLLGGIGVLLTLLGSRRRSRT